METAPLDDGPGNTAVRLCSIGHVDNHSVEMSLVEARVRWSRAHFALGLELNRRDESDARENTAPLRMGHAPPNRNG